MRVWKEVSKPQTFLHVTEANCDRCGKSCRVAGAGADRVAWGEVDILIQGENDHVLLDLCQDCSQKLIGWFTEKRGAKIRTTRDRIAEMDREARLSA